MLKKSRGAKMKVGAEMEVEQCRNESRCSQTHLKRIPVIDPRNTPDCGKRCTASLSVRKVRFQPKNEGRNRAKSGEIGPKMGQKGLTARPLPSRLRKRAKFSQNAGRNSEFTGIRNRCTASLSGVTIGPLRACSAKYRLSVHRFGVTIGSQWHGFINRGVHKQNRCTRTRGSKK